MKKLKKESNGGKENLDDDEPLSSGKEFYYLGCTAVVCLITKHDIYCANAGDSRCMIYRNKNVEDMSEDHKPDNRD